MLFSEPRMLSPLTNVRNQKAYLKPASSIFWILARRAPASVKNACEGGDGENKGKSDSDGEGCSEGYGRDDVEVASDGDSNGVGDCDRDGDEGGDEDEGGCDNRASENLGDSATLVADDDILVPMCYIRLQDKITLQISWYTMLSSLL